MKMMENRTLNKILLIVISVSLLGILTTNILTSPIFKKGILKPSSSDEVVISSDLAESSENRDAAVPAQNDETVKKYNLNTVTLELLLTVPNIGETKAKEILELREKLGKYTSVSQLKSVKGIGSKTYEKLKDYFYV